MALQEGNCALAALTAASTSSFEQRDESRDLPGRWIIDGRFPVCLAGDRFATDPMRDNRIFQ